MKNKETPQDKKTRSRQCCSKKTDMGGRCTEAQRHRLTSSGKMQNHLRRCFSLSVPLTWSRRGQLTRSVAPPGTYEVLSDAWSIRHGARLHGYQTRVTRLADYGSLVRCARAPGQNSAYLAH